MTSTDEQSVFSLSGQIDLSNCEQVEIDLTRAADESTLRIVRVDCSTLDFIDSSGLHIVIRLDRRLRTRGRSLVLAAVPDHFRKVLEITSFDHLIERTPAFSGRRNTRP